MLSNFDVSLGERWFFTRNSKGLGFYRHRHVPFEFYSGNGSWRYFCTVLTLKLDIHTEYYLGKRLILIAAVAVFHGIISRFMLSSNIFYIVLYALLEL